jgi:hypothetical protein
LCAKIEIVSFATGLLRVAQRQLHDALQLWLGIFLVDWMRATLATQTRDRRSCSTVMLHSKTNGLGKGGGQPRLLDNKKHSRGQFAVGMSSVIRFLLK